jgi:hypothetical protein
VPELFGGCPQDSRGHLGKFMMGPRVFKTTGNCNFYSCPEED